jgi:hypothetical protein
VDSAAAACVLVCIDYKDVVETMEERRG